MNTNATTAGEAYPLKDIVTDAELKSISLAPILNASSEKERRSLLPSHRCSWINSHMDSIFSSSKPNKQELCVMFPWGSLFNRLLRLPLLFYFSKVLYYISCLVAFKNISFNLKDQASLQEKLSAVPTIILDGFLSRFTETSRSSSQYVS